MRLRSLPFRLFTAAALIFLVVFLSQLIPTLFSGGYNHRTLNKPVKRQINVLEKSVYLRDNDTDQLVVFSAHRQEPFIFTILSSFGYFQRKVYCRYFGKKHDEIGKPTPVLIFPEFTAKCEDRQQAEFITLTVDKRDKVKRDQLTEIQKKRAKNNKFSVCLAPIYGDEPKWLTLIEFLEFYILQGADHFYVYVLQADDLVQNILRYYKKKDLVEVITMKNNTGCLNRHRCRHEVQLQECLTRARYNSKLVATVDLDERIVPVKGTLRTYVESRVSPRIGEFRFRCQWVLRYRDIPEKIPNTFDELRKELPTVLWHNTSHVAPLNHTTKSIIDPGQVESMGVHQVLRFSKGSTVFLVPPKEAVVRHYRLQKNWGFFLKEAESFGNFSSTSIGKKLQKELIMRIKRTLCGVFNKICS